MKAWYSKVRDTELKDGSVRATYVVTFETDDADLKREVEKYLQGIMDKTEPTSSKMEQVDKDINVRSKDEPTTQMKTQKSNLSFEKADEPQTVSLTSAHISGDIYHKVKDEPQTDCSWK